MEHNKATFEKKNLPFRRGDEAGFAGGVGQNYYDRDPKAYFPD